MAFCKLDVRQFNVRTVECNLAPALGKSTVCADAEAGLLSLLPLLSEAWRPAASHKTHCMEIGAQFDQFQAGQMLGPRRDCHSLSSSSIAT